MSETQPTLSTRGRGAFPPFPLSRTLMEATAAVQGKMRFFTPQPLVTQPWLQTSLERLRDVLLSMGKPAGS